MKVNHPHNASFFHLISVPVIGEKCVKAKGRIFWIIKTILLNIALFLEENILKAND